MVVLRGEARDDVLALPVRGRVGRGGQAGGEFEERAFRLGYLGGQGAAGMRVTLPLKKRSRKLSTLMRAGWFM